MSAPAARRTAFVARIDLEAPAAAIAVPGGYDEILLIVRSGDHVFGQVRRPFPPSGELTVEDQRRAIDAAVGPAIVRHEARRRFLAAALPEPPARPDPTVTVVVCTRDRPADLERCLDSLLRLSAAPEIVVVDNASEGDATERVVAARPGVRHVREPVPGQSRARNRGAAVATGELVAYTDDDCVAEPAWLDGLGAPFADPLVGAVTGYIGPATLDHPAQYLFELHGGFERRPLRFTADPAQESPSLLVGRVGAGANMVVRRDALVAIGGFDEGLGPGTPARSSDDKDAFYRLMRAGFRIAYDPARVVWHRHRDTPEALRAIFSDYGIAEFAMSTKALVRERDPEILHVWRWWGRHFAKEIRSQLVGADDRIPPDLVRAEITGALRGPARWVRSAAGRRGITPVPIPPREPPARAAPAVTREAPEVTLTIATRNRSAKLRALLGTLAAQTLDRERFEVVVVVDGATDDSVAMARGLTVPYRLRVIDQPPRGLATTRNRGAREAEHPVVVFFDDDIEPVPGLLAEHSAAHAGTADPTVVLGHYLPAHRGHDLWGRRQAAWWHDHFRRKAEPRHQWTFVDYVDGNTSLAVADLAAVGWYDERFTGGRRQDWELGVRLLRAGHRFVCRPEASGLHHFDARIETAFRVGRDEGRLDVQLARLHPDMAGHLPLQWTARQFVAWPLKKRIIHHPAADDPRRWEAYVRVLNALEAAERQDVWTPYMRRFLSESYAQGVLDALPDPDERARFLTEVAAADGGRTLHVDLAAPRADDVPPGAGLIDVALSWHGWPLGRVPAMSASDNWSWPDVADRIADLPALRSTKYVGELGLGRLGRA